MTYKAGNNFLLEDVSMRYVSWLVVVSSLSFFSAFDSERVGKMDVTKNCRTEHLTAIDLSPKQSKELRKLLEKAESKKPDFIQLTVVFTDVGLYEDQVLVDVLTEK